MPLKSPDRKERELVSYYRDRVVTDAYDERDVAALVAGLRQVVKPNRVMFELGSFLAHRRRTKGDFHRFFRSGVTASATPSGLRLGMDAKPIYSSADILNSMNVALAALELRPVPTSVVDGVLFCLIALLQDITFKDKSNANELGRLFLAFNADEIFSIAAVRVGARAEQLVPVLRVSNHWLKWAIPDHTTGSGLAFLATPNEWLTVERTSNGLTPVSH